MKFQFELLFSLVVFGLTAAGATTVLPIKFGSTWDYRVDGQYPGQDWNQLDFPLDSSWLNAAAPIGYGENDNQLSTDVEQRNPRPSTYYFRREFTLNQPEKVFHFDLNMKVDDGAIVYINGIEVARYNMDLNVTDLDIPWALQTEEDESAEKAIPVAYCQPFLNLATRNVLAVSLHQAAPDSSDIRMDLKLTAFTASSTTPLATPANLKARQVDGTNQVALEWTRQNDASFFRILRQAEGDKAWEVISAKTLGTSTSFIDEHAKPDTTYLYKMFAVNEANGRSECSQARKFPDSPPVLAQEQIVTTPGKSVSFLVQSTDADGDDVTMSLVQNPNGTQFTFTPTTNNSMGTGTLKFLSTNTTDVGTTFTGTVSMADGLSTTSFVKVVKVIKATTFDDCVIAIKSNCPCSPNDTKVKNCVKNQAPSVCDESLAKNALIKPPTYKLICPDRIITRRNLRHSPNDDENLE